MPNLTRQVVSAITELHRRLEYDQTKLAQAVYWIEEQVRDGPQPVEEIQRRARQASINGRLLVAARTVAEQTGKLIRSFDPARKQDGAGRWQRRNAKAAGVELPERASGEIWQRPAGGDSRR